MKKNTSKRYVALLIAFLVFTVAALVYRDARYKWNDIAYMVVPDVILSIAGSVMALCVFWDKNKIIKAVSFIAGFLVPNVFIWGVSMPLKEIISNGGVATSVALILLFVFYGVFGVFAFLRKSEAKKTAATVTAVLIAIDMLACAGVSAIPLFIKDTEEKYSRAVTSSEIFENDFDSAIPQTEIYNIVRNHFSSPLAEGKTEKKCVVIGFDGTRPDILSQYKDHTMSGINELLSEDGHAVLGYCGGVQWPQENTQMTSTAPGWCSILTGCWADVHGIYKNYVPKSLDTKTLFLTLIEDNLVDSTKFCVSWNGHFNNENCTYYPEKQYAEQNNINATYLDATDDNGTLKNVTSDLSSADCTDFLFCIFEQCDHVGHQTNFTPDNFGYVNAFKNDDEYAYNIIDTIKARETYNTEDWLIVITTDHGGYGDEHGGATKQERFTFIVANKEIEG